MSQVGDAAKRPYLEDIPLDEACARLLEAIPTLRPLPGELLPLDQCLGRITAAPLFARLSSPHYAAAAMDGFAVRAAETLGASETAPVRLRHSDQALYVDTGDPIPPGFDAVVMVEDVQRPGLEVIELVAPIAPWQHVRPLGEDIVASELVLPVNHLVRPADLGAAAAAGHAALLVRRRPRVTIIPTGDELVSPGVTPRPGEIIEYNALVLGAMASAWGAEVRRMPMQPDDLDTLIAALRDALHWADLVAINAGSSAGSEDYTAAAIAALGSVHVHGIAIKPGHPAILGEASGKPVLGIPGYPVSAALAFELIAEPIIRRLQGLPPPDPDTLDAVLARKLVSPAGLDEYVRVTLGRVAGRMVASPLGRGAGVITTLADADGLLLVPRFSEGYHQGATVRVRLVRPRTEIEHAILATGSHDPALDLLTNWLRAHRSPSTLSSSNVGSVGGLLALRDRAAHLAGCHLLDPASGTYNLPYIRRLLPDIDVVVVTLAHRMQGFIVAPGNPKRISGIADLARVDVGFINRQKGSGTRLLFEHELGRAGISPEQVRGHEREEYTHLGVAAAVGSGAADTGIGILAAARALGLDFVPLGEERYDLVISKADYESPLLHDALAALHASDFARDVEAMGGYRVDEMGRKMAELGPGSPSTIVS